MKQIAVFALGFLCALVLTTSQPAGSAGEYGTPTTPQPYDQNPYLSAHFDKQVHSRNQPWTGMPNVMAAQHGANCAAPPATHAAQAMGDMIFVCADHVMTALDSGDGYAEAVLTPSQLLHCAASCVVQFDISTERMSNRDWWALTLSPWADNVTLPFADVGADLQGPPRNGFTISGQDGSALALYTNGASGGYFPNFTAIGSGIAAGVNQAAVRQTFKLTLTPGHLKFERLASATAPALVFHDVDAPVQMLSDYVVQFEHHSYNPTKVNPGDPGVPATWHWSGFMLNPATPFNLIHATPSLVLNPGGTITFDAPAPTNAYLRFSGICRVLVDGVVAQRQIYSGHPEHFASYFVPIAQGKQNVQITFAADDWYGTGLGCAVQDAAVWAKVGVIPPATPTPTLTPAPQPSATPTPTSVPPTPTNTPAPGQRRQCTLRWGSNTIESYGNLTQAECAARGN